MATWTSDVDVLVDLDKLSEFSAGCDHIKDIPIVAYSSYGRGSLIGDQEALRLPSPEVSFNFNLFSVCLIHRGCDPTDMELVNTEIKLQISCMK
jgi:hypothetical protein